MDHGVDTVNRMQPFATVMSAAVNEIASSLLSVTFVTRL